MNKLYKVGIICAAVGLVIFLAGFVVSGFNIFDISNQQYFEKKTMEIDNRPNEINISDCDANVNLKKSSDDKIHITYYENNDEKYVIEDGDVLSIKKNDNRKFKVTIGINLSTPELTVELPEKFIGDITLNLKDGNIDVSDIKTKNLNLDLDDGNVTLSNVNSGNGKLECNVKDGNISTNDVSFMGMEVDTVDGNIYFNNFSSGVTKFKTIDGNVEINNCSSNDNVDCSVSDGNITLDNLTTLKNLTCNSVDGNITFKSISCDGNIKSNTSDGNITGSIIGSKDDFTIITDVKDGNNNLKDCVNKTGKELNLKVTDGNIDIDFED